MERRLRIAASLIAAGLLVELATLFWAHPTSFLVFLLAVASLVGLGVLLYLWTLLHWTTTKKVNVQTTSSQSSSP